MPIPKKQLRSGETVAVDVRPHWWHLAKPAVLLVGAIVAGIVTLTATGGGSTMRDVLGWLAVAALVGLSVWLILRYLRWSSTSLVVTTERIVQRRGVVGTSSVEIPLSRVSTVRYEQSAVERLLGAGDVLVDVGGEQGRHRFDDLRNPARIQRAIHVQLDALSRRSRIPASDSVAVASQLERLEGMYERGSLTRDQFEAQKTRVLHG